MDAWAIWDPYWAAIEKSLNPRVLTTSRGLVSNHSYYLASRDFANLHPDIIGILFDELTRSDLFVQQNHAEAVRIVAGSTGLDPATIDVYIRRRPRAPVGPLTAAMSDEQQGIADAFFRQKLIPKPIRVKDVFWQPQGKAGSN